MESVIKFDKIFKNFGSKIVLEDICFEIKSGEIVTIIGPNGAGKSTIAKLALGIEKSSSGEILKKKGMTIGYVPQKLDINPNLPLDIKSFLEILANVEQLSSEELKTALQISMISMDLDTKIKSLSGGHIQRLLIAAAILKKPDLLVLDEPLQGLDVNGQVNFYNIIESIQKNYNSAILMISHDLFTVMKKSSEVLCLNKHICCRGKAVDIVTQSEYLNIFGPEAQNIGVYKHHHDHVHG